MLSIQHRTNADRNCKKSMEVIGIKLSIQHRTNADRNKPLLCPR